MRVRTLPAAILALTVGCSPAVVQPSGGGASGTAPSADATAPTDPDPTPAPKPEVNEGGLSAGTTEAVERMIDELLLGDFDREALATIVRSRDARLGWVISDLLRFTGGPNAEALADAFAHLTGVNPRPPAGSDQSLWARLTNLLIGWDLPAPPGYADFKADLFLAIEPSWEPFFADADSDIDWRLVSWGGVYIDDRPLGDPHRCPRGCIPALDDPELTPAADGAWYPDERLVFGIVVGDEAVAFPKHIMEVHEMVNVTIGGRRIGMPYCTLCASAQAYFTDSVPEGIEIPVLRTSGLLSLSNKVMYDLVSMSAFDTFTGRAVSGPLRERGIVLEQATVVVSSWGEWKTAHPDTSVVAEDGGIGWAYPDDPLGDRDDDGPIFPTAPVDPRLPAQALVVGVIGPDAMPVAFPVDLATAELAAGREVALGAVVVELDGGGLRVRLRGAEELATHQSFWFAWSQFHPDTAVWTPLSR